MRRVSSAEFVRNFSAFCDTALADPVVLTRNGRDRLVITSLDQYRHLLSLALLNEKDETGSEAISTELEFLTRPPEAKAGTA